MSDRYEIIIQPEAEQGIKDAYFWLSNYSPRQARSWLEFYPILVSNVKFYFNQPTALTSSPVCSNSSFSIF